MMNDIDNEAPKSCGICARRKNGRCKKCHAKRMAEITAANRVILAQGKCPDCGLPLKRNNALTGWWQCVAYGEPTFRQKGFETAPKCSFQMFTE